MRIDARKWAAAKLLPRKYSEKHQIEHTGEMTIKRSAADMTDDELARIATASGK